MSLSLPLSVSVTVCAVCVCGVCVCVCVCVWELLLLQEFAPIRRGEDIESVGHVHMCTRAVDVR
jgi:hypothetical protein